MYPTDILTSTYERIPLDRFPENFSTTTELSSVSLDGSVQSVSDEFFAEAHHLLLVEPAPSLKGQFGPKGALFSGWESRRHNPDHDWCIIKLGTTGYIIGFDVDTAHFNGNEAPEVSVHALLGDVAHPPGANDGRWTEVLPKVGLGPSSRHLFKIPQTDSVNYVKLCMHPDGGIARFRVYGLVSPVRPRDVETVYDLAHVFAGGRVVYTSDQHFGVGSNLILPGRGKDMGDGWETKRSRQPGHKDWAIIKLGDSATLSHAEIDTAHFKGNFPESCELHATYSTNLVPYDRITEDKGWELVLPRVKLGPHRKHEFQLVGGGGDDKVYTHVRITIYPDGGVKRVRIFGKRNVDGRAVASGGAGRLQPLVNRTVAMITPPLTGPPSPTTSSTSVSLPPEPAATVSISPLPSSSSLRSSSTITVVVPALSLTPEAFLPYGQVVQSYPDPTSVPNPRHTRITGANQGTAVKYHKLAPVVNSYPPLPLPPPPALTGNNTVMAATTGLSVYRCKPVELTTDGKWEVKLLERHPCTNQAFIPMGDGIVTSKEEEKKKTYMVIVALNGVDDKPDLKTLRAFVAKANQGIVYDVGIWHHPMAVLQGPMDFTCVETQIGNDHPLDCEIFDMDSQGSSLHVQVPIETNNV